MNTSTQSRTAQARRTLGYKGSRRRSVLLKSERTNHRSGAKDMAMLLLTVTGPAVPTPSGRRRRWLLGGPYNKGSGEE